MNCLRGLPLKDRRVLFVSAAYLFLVTRVCAAASGENRNIMYITEDKTYRSDEQRSFCFKNALLPGWKEIWTRIQLLLYVIAADLLSYLEKRHKSGAGGGELVNARKMRAFHL
ncbi:hypothetical protein scyTo_0022384 [Scyliorhinus torazame]|uniref:Secreted protein n=1 Tax=Scyliorhinus torazame TaxID=75743 RepID=A0A401QB96_SCYTO|nr:hypothetical protein [Scyliorhinus torazame]